MGVFQLLPGIIAINVVAIAILYGRFAGTENGRQFHSKIQTSLTHILYPSLRPREHGHVCGLVPWEVYVLVSTRVVLPSGVQPAAVYISDGKIIKVDSDVTINGTHVLDFKDLVISPGVIDIHAHLNEPGRADWEGIVTGTTAAAVGGISTLIDMPLNSFPTTTVRGHLELKQELAETKAIVNVGHWAGLIPENAANHNVLEGLLKAGALGFKSFMSPSGIDDFPNVEAHDIAAALPFLKKHGVTFYIHAESVSDVPTSEGSGSPMEYLTYMSSRPPKFERDAINLLVKLLDEDTSPTADGFRVHIAHLSDSGCLPIIKAAQARGLPISVETCAHYLVFSSANISDGQTLYKCAPPIRDEANRQALIAAVIDGSINVISSDHSPAPPGLKQMESGDFLKAWGGISGLQYLLPATWTAISSAGGDLPLLSRVLSSGPAKVAGLQDTKGQIAEGMDADLLVWSPEEEADTSMKGNMHRHKLSPYTDKPLRGKAVATISSGHMMHLHTAVQRRPCGTVLQRNHQSR